MKEIDPQILSKIISSGILEKRNQPESLRPDGDNFKNLLNKKIETASNDEVSTHSGRLTEIEAGFPTGRVNRLSGLTPAAELLDASLNQLERYASWLEDPEKSLKETKSLLDLLVDQTASLYDTITPDPALNPELGDIIARLQIIVQNEQVKFNRGDYL